MKIRKLSKPVAIGFAVLALTGCQHQAKRMADGKPRFEVLQCRSVHLLSRYKECDDDQHDTVEVVTHCVVVDRKTGCRVGAVRTHNPDYIARALFGKSEFLYSRLYDWRCPSGVAPPERRAFRFEDNYTAPRMCTPKDAGYDELLKPEQPL